MILNYFRIIFKLSLNHEYLILSNLLRIIKLSLWQGKWKHQSFQRQHQQLNSDTTEDQQSLILIILMWDHAIRHSRQKIRIILGKAKIVFSSFKINWYGLMVQISEPTQEVRFQYFSSVKFYLDFKFDGKLLKLYY